MFRALLFVFGAVVAGCVAAYLVTGRPLWLKLARRLFGGGLAVAVVFFAVLLLKRLI